MPVALGSSRRINLSSGSKSGGNRHVGYGDDRSRSRPKTAKREERPSAAKANSYLRRHQASRSAERSFGSSLCLPSVDVGAVCGAFAGAFALVAGLAFMALFSLALLMGYRYATSIEYFALREVTIQGNQRLARDEVRAAAGLEPGANALGLNIRDVEISLLRNPWIETAVVRRVLPGTLQITIGERKAAYCLKRNELLYYADDTGKVIAPVEAESAATLPLLEVTEDGQRHGRILRELAKLLEQNVLPFGPSRLAHIRLSAKSGLDFSLEGKDLTLSAALGDWRENVTRLGKVWTDLQKRKELEAVASIRAYGDQVLVEKRVEPRK